MIKSKKLSKINKFDIVVRPHPAENIEPWKVFLDGVPNVHIIRGKFSDTFSIISSPFAWTRSMIQLQDETQLLREKNVQLTLNKQLNDFSDEFIKKIMVSNSSILIFDDINDTGDTLSNIKNKFRDYNMDLRFAVLINNKSSSFKVDYYGSEIDKKIDNSWIVFPWENIDGE